MKHTLVRLAGLLLVLCLLLSGCNLIEVDPVMQTEEDLAALKEQYSDTVATYDGGEITIADVLGNFYSQYSYYYQMYSMFGMTMDSDTATSIRDGVIDSAVTSVAVCKQFDERGLELSEETLEEIKTTADENWEQVYESYASSVEAESDEELAVKTEYALYADGYTYDVFYNDALYNEKYTAVQESVYAEITEVTDEELQAAYEEKVSEDEETYSENPGSLASAMTSEDTVVYWIPEGYRTVKHILVKPEDEVLTAVTDARTALDDANEQIAADEEELAALNDDDAEDTEAAEAEETEEETRTAEEVQAEIDSLTASLPTLEAAVADAEAACLASVQEKTDAIYAALAAGEDFDAVMAEYGEDPGMQSEPSMTTGYYVSADVTTWDANFKKGAMLLENVGDYTLTPVISTSGVHIIKYVADVESGAVALETVHDTLYDETLTSMQEERFSDDLTQWVEALNPVYNYSALNIG